VPVVAGVDSSTQSTKVELRAAETGELLGTGRAPHPAVTPPVAEQDPAAWWEALIDALRQAETAAETQDLAAISIAGQQHGCVVLDKEDQPIRPAKLWCDTTSAADAEWLVDQLPGGRAGWAQATGSVPLASFTITKLSWLHRSDPATWLSLRRVCLPHDWLTFQLTGRFVTDRGDASGTGYWSPSEERYRPDLLALVDDRLDWPAMLPDVLGPIDPAGAWRDRPGVVVGPGTGDNMAAALGLGLEPGDVVISVGTSGTVFAASPQPTADPSGTVAGFADATGGFLPLVCTLNATKVTDTVARLLGVSLEELDELALRADPGAGGLTLLPYLDGERTPDRPEATGVLGGVTTGATREAVARAAFEGVVCGLLDGLDALGDHVSVEGGRCWLVGGGARSRAYRQILADLSGRPIVTSGLDETVATGAAVQAAAVLARCHPLEITAAWELHRTEITEPSPGVDRSSIRTRYAELRDR
jgi:xylulokinase